MGTKPGRISAYQKAGVDVAAGAKFVDAVRPLASSTHRPGVISGIGGFGGLFDLAAAGFTDSVLVAAADGVGTKIRIAVETGRLDTVGIDLVAMCVNDLICQGAEPLFFLDYYAAGTLDPAHAGTVVASIAEGCKTAGAALLGGETAEMPGLYRGTDFDLAGFAIGAVNRDALLPRPVETGDVALGLASSGPHSNGFSLLRRLVAESGLGWDEAAPFEAAGDLASAMLEPTRIYVAAVLALHRARLLRAVAHVTGGGITENAARILPLDIALEIDLAGFPLPPLFAWVAATAKMDDEEMLATFNGGIGMIVICPPDAVDQVRRLAEQHGETVFQIGAAVPREEGAAIRYHGKLAAS